MRHKSYYFWIGGVLRRFVPAKRKLAGGLLYPQERTAFLIIRSMIGSSDAHDALYNSVSSFGFVGGAVPSTECSGDCLSWPVECGQVEFAERAGGREGCEGFADSGTDAGDQLFRAVESESEAATGFCGF